MIPLWCCPGFTPNALGLRLPCAPWNQPSRTPNAHRSRSATRPEAMYELALFAGAGGGILGGKLLGWTTVCAVEIEPGARAKLAARQNDGCLKAFPIWGDVRSFTIRNRATRPAIRALRRKRNKLVITGGFPCQDISLAGDGDGLDGERSGMWFEQARVIGEIRPLHVVVENSPTLTIRGGLRVIGELARLGYDCHWGIISAADAIWLDGPPCLDHLRERIWIIGTRADANQIGCRRRLGELRTKDYGEREQHGQRRPNARSSSVRHLLLF